LLKRSNVFALLALVAGTALLMLGIAINWNVAINRGEDFNHLYVMAVSLIRGFDVFTAPDLRPVYQEITGDGVWVPWGFFYTPSAGVVALPLAVIPFQVARVVWFVLSNTVLLVGASQLIQLMAPRLKVGYRALVLGALLCASGTRWAFLFLQAAPLVLGLLCMFVVAVQRRRFTLAFFVATVAMCLKITLGLPFLGLAIVQRRYALAGAIAGAWLLINGLGFLRVGGLDAMNGYQANMSRFEQADQVNYPDFRVPTSMARLDWPYLFNAISPDLPRSAFLSMVVTAILAAWLFWQALRCRHVATDPRTLVAFLGPVVALSLLGVYHHHYDAILLAAPVIAYLCYPADFDRRLALLFVIPVVLFAGVYQVGNAETLAQHFLGTEAVLLLRLYGVLTAILVFGVSLVLLQGYVASTSELRALPHQSG
jgi:hypothetical protein